MKKKNVKMIEEINEINGSGGKFYTDRFLYLLTSMLIVLITLGISIPLLIPEGIQTSGGQLILLSIGFASTFYIYSFFMNNKIKNNKLLTKKINKHFGDLGFPETMDTFKFTAKKMIMNNEYVNLDFETTKKLFILEFHKIVEAEKKELKIKNEKENEDACVAKKQLFSYCEKENTTEVEVDLEFIEDSIHFIGKHDLKENVLNRGVMDKKTKNFIVTFLNKIPLEVTFLLFFPLALVLMLSSFMALIQGAEFVNSIPFMAVLIYILFCGAIFYSFTGYVEKTLTDLYMSEKRKTRKVFPDIVDKLDETESSYYVEAANKTLKTPMYNEYSSKGKYWLFLVNLELQMKKMSSDKRAVTKKTNKINSEYEELMKER